MGGKECRTCGTVKPLADYPVHPMMADGRLHDCKVCVAAYKARHYRENAEAIKELRRARYKEKREAILAESRRRYKEDAEYRERVAQQHKLYAARHPEKVKDAARRGYRKRKTETPDYFAEQQRRARARAKGLTDLTLTLAEWREILAQYDHRCAYCGSNRDITMDHQVPIQRGGRHDKENVVPACRQCNASKRDMTVAEWIAEGGFGRRKRGR